MKTLKSTLEIFSTDAMTQNEMLFIIGGGGESPLDMVIPPKGMEDE